MALKRFLFSIFIVFSPLFFNDSPQAHAQTQSVTDVYTLGEIVVSGQREGVESVATVREVTDRDIQNKRCQNP